MLDHLTHHNVGSLDEAIPLIGYEWTVFHFPHGRNTKPALYGRMWRIRALGIDCMVRATEDAEYVLIARKEVDDGA